MIDDKKFNLFLDSLNINKGDIFYIILKKKKNFLKLKNFFNILLTELVKMAQY